MPTVTVWHASWCAPCRGTLRALVPALREDGVEPVLVDVDWHPCEARDRGIDHLPTVTVDEGDAELMRCRGYPTRDAVGRIIELCTRGQGATGDGGFSHTSET